MSRNDVGLGGCLLLLFLFLVVYAVVILLGGWVFFLLYNLIADPFAWPALTYWQSVAAVALISFVAGFFHSTVGDKD